MTYSRSNSIKKSVMLTTAALAAVTLGGVHNAHADGVSKSLTTDQAQAQVSEEQQAQ